jgi:prepilin-type N-terminal cleavage/methylation domain-containing protein
MTTNPQQTRKLPRRFNGINGFTLVELLVVIVIIAVLASVVMVMTRKIKSSAQQVNALSTLRQVGTFHIGYATENSGDINTMRWAEDPKEGGPGKWVSNTFWGRFQSFIFADSPPTDQKQLSQQINQRLDQLFNSPDANKMVNTVISKSKIYHDTSGLPVPLAFNQMLNPWNKFVKLTSIGDPAQILYATYGFGFFNEADGRSYVARPLDGSTPKNNIYYLENRKALAIYLDGHVETLTAPISPRSFE